MNRKWLVLLLVLLLCGCRSQQTPKELDGVSVPAIAVTEPTVTVGFYAPESPVEVFTDGAVKAFPLGLDDAVGIRMMGSDILLFSGQESTTLTLLSGEGRYIKAQRQLSCVLSPDDPSVIVDSRGIAYVDQSCRLLTVLDDRLEEIYQTDLPEHSKTVALSADRRLLYYCTEDALRVLNLESGLDRLLREMAFPGQELTALHCDDTVLQCSAVYTDGSRHTLFIAADTGMLLYECAENIPLWTSGDFYVALHMDGTYPEWLTGSGHSEPQVLVLESEPTLTVPVPQMSAMLTYRREADNTALLECYRLDSGCKFAKVILPEIPEPKSIHWEQAGNTLWFLAFDPSSGQDVLYGWSLEDTPVVEEDTYLQPRWSRENPDSEGLAQCSLLARQLSVKHDVHVLIWTDATAVQPWDYTLEAEYQVPLLRRRLEELDTILSCYPEGFLKKAAAATGTGRLSICLVRSINGKPETSALDSAMGLQFWDKEARAYLAITVGPDMAQHLYHELFHIIDSRVLSTCNAYDDWKKLNPKGFSYDVGYIADRSDEGQTYLNQKNRYFIDLYAMSYPKEDRARIMEYAMLDGQAALFQSAPMQAKLRKLCQGIRVAFGLEQESVNYRWEQYLDQPLASA